MTLITLFSAPKPVTNPHIAMIQRNAIRSWTLLPDVEVILLGEEDGLAEAARDLGVQHIPHVARNANGTPLISSMFQLAREHSTGDLLCIVNADMIPQQLTLTGPAYAGVPVSNVMKGTADVLVAPQLAGTDTTWYLFDTTKPMKPFIYQNRQAPQFTFLNRPDSENLFFRKKFIFGADARAAAGYGLWQLALKSTP